MPEGATQTANAPMLRRISDYPSHWAGRMPDAPAMFFGEHRWTFQQFSTEVDRYARALLAAGVQKGDRVSVLSTPRPEFFVTFLAAASIGAIWLGLNPRYTPRELARTLSDANPSVVLALAAFEGENLAARLAEAAAIAGFDGRLAVFGGAQEGFEPVDGLLKAGEVIRDDELATRRAFVQPQDPVLIVYTSGSTGVPKGSLLTHFGLCHAYTTQTSHFDIAGACIICNMPINHIGCVGDLCCAPMVGGGAITFMERFDAPEILTLIDSGQVHCMLGVPTMLQILTELPSFETSDFSRVRLICWGGAALPYNVLLKLREKNVPLGVTYGMSEVPGSITMSALGASDDDLTKTVGRPTRSLDLRLVADDGKVCEVGEEGEVRVRHPSVLSSYFNRPQATAEAFDDEGYFRTGDVGVLDASNNMKLVGRKKEMFKSGGYNVYPREIELCLEQHPDVALAAVIGVPDELYQEVGHAFVIAKSDVNHTGLAEQLAAWCRERLANYKRPKRINVSSELPLLPVGKVDKVELKRRLSNAG